jgi:tyrosine-protein kinase Etk/Wzc
MKHLDAGALMRPRRGDDYIDLASTWRVVWQRKWSVALIALLVFVLGCAYALLLPSTYQANILLKVDVGDAAGKNIPANLSGIFESKTASSAELEMLHSRSVVTGAVESGRLYLDAAPKYLPLIGPFIASRSTQLSEPGLFGHGGYVWGTESIDVQTFEVPDAFLKKAFTLTVDGPTAYTLRYKDSVHLSGTVGTDALLSTPEGKIRIKVAGFDGRPGAEYVIRRVSMEDAVEKLQKDLVIGEKYKSSGIISVSLQDANPARAAATLNEIARQYLQQNVDLKTEEAERSLAFVESQLPGLKSAIESTEAKYNAFKNARGTVDVGEEVKSALQQSVQSQLRLGELRQRRDELLTRYQEANPLVEAVNQQIKTVSAEIGTINARMRKVPGIEQDALQLTRDIKVNTDLYASLLNTAQQLRLAKASRMGSAKLIDPAVAPSTPVKPNRKLIAAGSAAAGLFLGICVAFIRRSFANVIDSQHQLVELVNVPLGAVLPHSAYQAKLSGRMAGTQPRVNLLADDATEEGAIESLRTLRATLAHSLADATSNIIAIVGPTSGVGKSFVAANLSALLASSGKRVVLVDADLRGGFLHRYFGAERNAGLAELVSAESSIGEVTRMDVVPNLDFISTGAIRARPADALANGTLGKVLAKLSARYDHVVIDTAPVLAVADSLIVSSHAGLIFCVARRGVTTVAQILEAKERFEQSGHPITSMIFNDARRSDVSYGSGYRRIPLTYEQPVPSPR